MDKMVMELSVVKISWVEAVWSSSTPGTGPTQGLLPHGPTHRASHLCPLMSLSLWAHSWASPLCPLTCLPLWVHSWASPLYPLMCLPSGSTPGPPPPPLAHSWAPPPPGPLKGLPPLDPSVVVEALQPVVNTSHAGHAVRIQPGVGMAIGAGHRHDLGQAGDGKQVGRDVLTRGSD